MRRPSRARKLFSLVSRAAHTLVRAEARYEQVLINQGRLLSELLRANPSPRLQDHEFKVFSQWGEDGILQKLVRSIEIRHRTFVEFGVEDFQEANCRFLMIKDNWSGFVLDGSPRHIARLRRAWFYWAHQLEAVDAFITRDNIGELLARSGFDPDLGVLSVDLDGNDYWVLERLGHWRPRILVTEYNPAFGPDRRVTIPYDAAFVRMQQVRSNLYYGASLAALASLVVPRGYALVGTNGAGNNAFFVRDDVMTPALQRLTVAEAFTPNRFREALDAHGEFTFRPAAEAAAALAGLPVHDLDRGAVVPF